LRILRDLTVNLRSFRGFVRPALAGYAFHKSREGKKITRPRVTLPRHLENARYFESGFADWHDALFPFFPFQPFMKRTGAR
jgi:hypothetical protein